MKRRNDCNDWALGWREMEWLELHGPVGKSQPGLEMLQRVMHVCYSISKALGWKSWAGRFIFGTQFTLAWILHILEQCMAFVLNWQKI